MNLRRLAIAALLACVLSGCGGPDSGEDADPLENYDAPLEEVAPVEDPTITYVVSGDIRTADLTFQTEGGTSQRAVKIGDKAIEVQMPTGEFVYLAAQNSDPKSAGEIACSIRASDGSTISENTSSGAFAIATCEGEAR